MFRMRWITSDRRCATLCVEDFPSISATVLRVLRERSSYRPHDPLQRIAMARSSDASKFVFIGATDRDDEVTLDYIHNGRNIRQTVGTVERVVGALAHRLFICPLTGRRVRTLYFVRGSFCSRHAYNLPYSTQVDCKLDRYLNRRDVIIQELAGRACRGRARGPAPPGDGAASALSNNSRR